MQYHNHHNCQLCDKKFGQNIQLIIHIRSAHEGQKNHKYFNVPNVPNDHKSMGIPTYRIDIDQILNMVHIK